MALSLRTARSELTRPDAPFAGVIGAGRRAAWRRRLIRRVLAVALVAGVLTLILLRPSAPSGGSPSDEATAGQEAAGQDGAGLLDQGAAGDGDDDDAQSGLDPDNSPGGTAAQRAGPGDSLGAESVPAGRIGLSLPADPAVAARLEAGDRVDVYRAGSDRALSRAALVIDVARSGGSAATGGDPAAPYGPEAAVATVFLAVTVGDARRISAGQRGDAAGEVTWLVTVLPRADDAVP